MTDAQNTGTLYLRGVPRKLVREAKAQAARRGMSLTAFVKEAVAQAIGVEAPTERGEGAGSVTRDLRWFEVNKTKLLRRYANEYVAIINRKVVDHDRDFDVLARRVFERHGVKSICMPKVVPGEREVRIPSPRVAR